nr:hypothetical protein Iba_chr10eCG9000 [Ipomoea batatas]
MLAMEEIKLIPPESISLHGSPPSPKRPPFQSPRRLECDDVPRVRMAPNLTRAGTGQKFRSLREKWRVPERRNGFSQTQIQCVIASTKISDIREDGLASLLPSKVNLGTCESSRGMPGIFQLLIHSSPMKTRMEKGDLCRPS